MTGNHLITESPRADKFNIKWQIVRTQARSLKGPQEKIKHVIKYLNDNKNIHNYGRVHNWLKMTGVAYKGDDREHFDSAIQDIEKRKSEFDSTDDVDSDLTKISKEDLQLVYNDLQKRKYGFQYKSVPKAHTQFVQKLKDELDKR